MWIKSQDGKIWIDAHKINIKSNCLYADEVKIAEYKDNEEAKVAAKYIEDVIKDENYVIDLSNLEVKERLFIKPKGVICTIEEKQDEDDDGISPLDLIAGMGYEDVIIFDNPDYESAFIGISNTNCAVYDYDLMLEYLIKENVCETYEDAADFIGFNDSFRQENEPIIVYKVY